jgi:hypothetical protein
VSENHGNPGALAVAILGAPQDQQAVETILQKAGVEIIYRHVRNQPKVRGTVELTVHLPATIRGR